MATRLQAMEDQHLICILGLGWMQAHHPWSKNGTDAYNAKHLLANLCLIVIPLAAILRVPDDATVKLTTAPDVCHLGTLSAIREELKTKKIVIITEFKHKGR